MSCSLPGDLPNPGTESTSLMSPNAVSSLSQLCPPNYGLSLSDYRPCPNLELGPGAKVGQEWSKSGARVGMWFRLEIGQSPGQF